ncbi:MAG: Citrate transporter [Clostridiaceae bacterium]|jgi:Na+/H+ antiporter NhaD/arsenite permease-like protein|nr:Citrate transporter [Clostridiaceae bacterium]
MNSVTFNINKIYFIKEKLKNEKVFSISLLLAISTCFFIKPQISYINFKVLVLLFNLMIIIAAFENLKVMDKIALEILSKCKNTRMVSLVFVIVTFFTSMLITNDVALLTFVPLSIFTFKKAKVDSMKTIIIQTLAANIGSSLTPMGNPQNLFLFTQYNLNALQFFSVTVPFVVLGMIWLLLLNERVLKKEIKLSLEAVHIKDKKRTIIYFILFLLIVFSVFGLIDYKYTFLVTVLYIVFMDKYLIKEVDYFLLATFICFFVFIGNISNIEFIQEYLRNFLQKPNMPYFSSILLSQIVSNVPCSVLVSGFTDNWREVLLGVNIGGMGTLIASLASLISYKIYMNEHKEKNKIYLNKFNLYNFVSLFMFSFMSYLYIIFKLI